LQLTRNEDTKSEKPNKDAPTPVREDAMSRARAAFLGCLVIPVLTVSSCAGKMYLDRRLYELPGPVLASNASPTQRLASALDVARTLDTYIQPRFEILRDKDFGAFRITYRKHAGVVQLKVDTPRERELIANANAARRDYAICLLRCAPIPGRGLGEPRLRLLYFNQNQIASENEYYSMPRDRLEAAGTQGFRLEAVEHQALEALDALRAGKEQEAQAGDWEVLMRPVLATKQACLGCHREAAPGATLGAMVYAVRRTPRKSAPERDGSAQQRTAWARRM
jgi:hypothetical protein